jgi:hypothetical protein
MGDGLGARRPSCISGHVRNPSIGQTRLEILPTKWQTDKTAPIGDKFPCGGTRTRGKKRQGSAQNPDRMDAHMSALDNTHIHTEYTHRLKRPGGGVVVSGQGCICAFVQKIPKWWRGRGWSAKKKKGGVEVCVWSPICGAELSCCGEGTPKSLSASKLFEASLGGCWHGWLAHAPQRHLLLLART